jgi:poly(3-hydroxybutyrate) depolymerase
MRASHHNASEHHNESDPAGSRKRINPACRPLGIDFVMIGTSRIDVTQAEIWTAPFCILRQLSRSNGPASRALVIPPLAGGFAILLRDVLIGLLRYRNVAVMDWLDARYVPARVGRFGLEDNIGYVISAIRALGPDVHVVAVCQGVVPALIATAILSAYESQAAPRSLILIAGPVDPLTNPTRVVELIRARSLDWFEKHVLETVPVGYPGEGRSVYPACHQLTNFIGYLGRHFARGGELFWKTMHDNGEDPVRFPFLSLCLPMMDLPAEFFLENVQYVFHGVGLRRSRLRFLNCEVDFNTIRSTALMTVEGDCDDISGRGHTGAAHGLCASIESRKRARLLVRGSGHFSLIHGDALRQEVLPAALDFMDAAEAAEERIV